MAHSCFLFASPWGLSPHRPPPYSVGTRLPNTPTGRLPPPSPPAKINMKYQPKASYVFTLQDVQGLNLAVHWGGDFRITNCHEMVLELVCGADFCCNRHCRTKSEYRIANEPLRFTLQDVQGLKCVSAGVRNEGGQRRKPCRRPVEPAGVPGPVFVSSRKEPAYRTKRRRPLGPNKNSYFPN